jgi:S-sulfosulfanyl-L-cysteine sulfohydrolase
MSQRRKLTILQINDTHAYLNEHWDLFRQGQEIRHQIVGGYARIKSYFNLVRAECGADAVLAFDNGDTLHGTYPAVSTKGEAIVGPLNQLQLDAWTVHWDYIYGTQRMQELASKISHPLLACNAYYQGTDELLFEPTVVFDRGGIRIGVIGLAAYIIDKAFPPELTRDVYFTLGQDELRRHIKELRDQDRVDLIVVLSHLGFPQDCQLASEIDGIDVFLSGHTHNRTLQPIEINGATIIQSGCHGSFVGRLDLEMSNEKLVSIGHQLTVMDSDIVRDPNLQQQIDAIYAPHQAMLDEVVGETTIGLNRSAALESTMDNLLLDAIAAEAGTEIAFSNGWRYGAPIPAGKITVNDLWNIIPTNPPVSLVDMSGSELWEMMEENLQRTYARNPLDQMGGYVKRCRGVNLYCKIENAFGCRIQEFFAEGDRLDLKKTYRVAFVTEQGVARKYRHNREHLNITAIAALQRYLTANSPVTPSLRDTVVAV